MGRRTAGERFWALTGPGPAGCIDWIGSRQKARDGRLLYGFFWDGKKVVSAHRFAWKLAYGEYPDGPLDHIECDRPGCVNVEHLVISTNRKNWERSQSPSNVNRLKTRCVRGHSLTEANIYRYVVDGRPVRKCKLCMNERRAERIAADPDGYRRRERERMRRSRAERKVD